MATSLFEAFSYHNINYNNRMQSVHSYGICYNSFLFSAEGKVGGEGPNSWLFMLRSTCFSLKAIEKAIVSSDVGMTPNNDGELIRLSIPQLTSERRKVFFHYLNLLKLKVIFIIDYFFFSSK